MMIRRPKNGRVIEATPSPAPILGPPPKPPKEKDPGAPGSNMGLKRRLTGRARR